MKFFFLELFGWNTKELSDFQIVLIPSSKTGFQLVASSLGTATGVSKVCEKAPENPGYLAIEWKQTKYRF
jgi:hypothetical protein